jgi:hypothetical protein
MTDVDVARVLEWMRTPNRKPAQLAFTAGPDRQAAYWIEIGQDEIRSQYHVNASGQAAVADGYYWLPIDENTPRGVKLQLLTVHGVGVIGQWDGRDKQWVGWAPMPKKRETM